MTARVVRESWGGGDLSVGDSQALTGLPPVGHVLISAYERGGERATLLLTPAEIDELIAALQAARAELVPCPTCTGPVRETTGLVCQTCGTDYGLPVGALAEDGQCAHGYREADCPDPGCPFTHQSRAGAPAVAS